jgi:D-alanyl-D-alanine carboxypeptidase (penicillin-binding protein 5/6)
MKERVISILGLLFLAGCATQPPAARTTVTQTVSAPSPVAGPPAGDPIVWPADAPAIYARHAIMIDAETGRTIYQKFADTQIQVASTQKLVTALVIADRGNLEGRMVVSPAATNVEPAKLYLRAGQTYPRGTLLAAMLVKSENDAAAALAIDHSGSMSAFADAMNRKAWSVGARNSHFLNAHGLPAPQYSTARDMARIAYRAYREPVLRRWMNTPYYTFTYSDGRVKSLESTNKLLKRSSAYNGMKTGYTFAAGRCLISSASVGGRDVILAQFGSKTDYIFNDAERMMQWGLAHTGGGMFAMSSSQPGWR